MEVRTYPRLWDVLGSHLRSVGGVAGVAFAVWAPNARRVSVVGDFNDWDGRRHPMEKQAESGVWETFVPGAAEGARYKYEIEGAQGGTLALKSDPLARYGEVRPANASIVWNDRPPQWRDGEWMRERAVRHRHDAAITIYEVHLSSWRRAEGDRALTYRELADQLLPYVAEMAFTHVEILPIAEYPFDGSWGYQPTGMFAPTSRHGTPEEFRFFVERAHELGIGVILDWAGAHFPSDPHGLAFFDGSHLYEYGDPRKGFSPDWNTLVYDYGRPEVANFLIASALFWLEEFHVDGLRVDAVAPMLYLDYSRRPGEWVPNAFGGNENLEAIALLRRLNEAVYARNDGAFTIAEESTAWPMLAAPVGAGGLGFGYRWNMGWERDTLAYFQHVPSERPKHRSDLMRALGHAYSETYVLPISHDEVVYGKHSLLRKMPGDRKRAFANLRLLLVLFFTQPGKKLLFMGNEFGATHEWDHDAQLDWSLVGDELHAGVQRLVRDCNELYRRSPALHRNGDRVDWIDGAEIGNGILVFARGDFIVAINALPVTRHAYRIGTRRTAPYEEVINTDSHRYGGEGIADSGGFETQPVAAHGCPHSLLLTLRPLTAVVLRSTSG
jgi:1,4-alpha-glucan branching enzyme